MSIGFHGNDLGMDWHHIRLALTITLLYLSTSTAKYSKIYRMPSNDCDKSYRVPEIDGAVILSTFNSLYTNSACLMKFKADGETRQSPSKFLVQFEKWEVEDCSLKLKIYNGQSSTLTPVRTLSCNESPEPFITSTKYVTLRLDKLRNSGYDFKIVLTAFVTGYCKEYRCEDEDQKCIDTDLRCDHASNCLSGSDEMNCANYTAFDPTFDNVAGGMKAVVAMIFIIAISCIVGIVVTIICCRRRARRGTIYMPTTPAPTGSPTQQNQQGPQPGGYGAANVPPPYQPSYGPVSYPPPGPAGYPGGQNPSYPPPGQNYPTPAPMGYPPPTTQYGQGQFGEGPPGQHPPPGGQYPSASGYQGYPPPGSVGYTPASEEVKIPLT